MHIGQAIRSTRERLGMTQEVIANEVGCDAGNISRVEMGKQSVSLERLAKIARAMQVRVSDLFIMIEPTATTSEREWHESEVTRYDEDMQSLRRAFIALDKKNRRIALDMIRSLYRNQRKEAAEAAGDEAGGSGDANSRG